MLYGSKNTPQGRWDAKSPQNKMFVEARFGGVHTADLAEYYDKSEDWRTYLIKATRQERNEIILAHLDPAMLKDAPKETEEALKEIGKYIPNVSTRFLKEYFQLQDSLIKELEEMRSNTDGSKLGWSWENFPIWFFASDINKAERKRFKKEGIPKLYYEHQRLVLEEVDCENPRHHNRCKVFVGNVYDAQPVESKILPRVGQEKLNWGIDMAFFQEIQSKAYTKHFGQMVLAEGESRDVEKIAEHINLHNWGNPYIYLDEQNIKDFGLTKQEVDFIQQFINTYEIEVTGNVTNIGMKKWE